MIENKMKFDELIGNLEVLQILFSSVLNKWKGTYIVTKEINENPLEVIIKERRETPTFYVMLCNTSIGKQLYTEGQIQAIKESFSSGHSIINISTFGTTQIVVPIIIDKNPIGAILCDGVRNLKSNYPHNYMCQLESELGYRKNELESLWLDLPQISDDETLQIKTRLDEVVRYLSDIGQQKIELNKAIYERQHEEELRRVWLQQITHQLVAPLHGIQGYAENIHFELRDLLILDKQNIDNKVLDKIQRVIKSTDYLIEISRLATRVANNLAWIVYPRDMERERKKIDSVLVNDFYGLVTRTVKEVQGIARQRQLKAIHVDKSIKTLDKQLFINDELFRQALENLIDNAVKYSTKGTVITINGEVKDEKGIIRVINFGLPVNAIDVENIFAYGYRSKEAIMAYPVGTGIGLSVARQIIELHGGLVIARPSEKTSDGWKTTFIIKLPIHSRQ